MYSEGNNKLSFNWGSLAIKLGILAVIIILLVVLFTRGSGSKKEKVAVNNDTYTTNIMAMKDSAFEYFTTSKLPTDMGGSVKLTLGQMINQKLLLDFTNDGEVCDLNSSYIQATKMADGLCFTC